MTAANEVFCLLGMDKALFGHDTYRRPLRRESFLYGLYAGLIFRSSCNEPDRWLGCGRAVA